MKNTIRAAAVALACTAFFAARSEAETPIAAAEKLLASKDWSERMKGLEQLESLPKSAQAEKNAIGALTDDDWGVEIRACKTLTKIGADAAKEALAKRAIDGEIQWVRDAAVDALRTLDPEGGGSLLVDRARATQDPQVKARAIQSAGIAGGKDLLKRLRPYAESKEPTVVAAALRSIGRVGASEAVAKEVLDIVEPRLSGRSDRKVFFIYAAALEALSHVASPAASGLLVGECVQQPDDDLYVQERIARGLAARPPDEVVGAMRTGFAQAKKPDEVRRIVRLAGRVGLKDSRTDIEPLLDHKEDRVRSEAAKALGLLKDPAAAPALKKALADKSAYVRIEAVSALARVLPVNDFLAMGATIRKDTVELIRLQLVVETADAGDPTGIAVLEPLLADPAWRVSSAAAAAIGTLGVVEDLPKLQPYLTAKTWQMRAAAFEGIGRLRAAAAIPILTEGLIDKDPVVRGVCHANLQVLTREKLGPDPKLWREWWTKNGTGLKFVKQSRRSAEDKAKDAEKNKRYATPTREQAVEVLQKARILVVTGAWDHVERVLEHLTIPSTVLRAQQLKEAGLNPNQVILVNCEGNMDKDSQERVQWFVNVGGYLMTTDWALTKTIEPAFSGYVKQFSGSSTGNDVVVVEDARPGHAFTRGVFENVPALKWWLEIQAFPITVIWPERTEVLVDSGEMRQRYGSSPMAVTFRWGLGKVQHSLSHFYLQEEGMQAAQKPRDRMMFAADNLGLSLEEIRRLAKEGRFDGALNDETMKQIAPDYSMFRLIVNVVREKSDWVENL